MINKDEKMILMKPKFYGKNDPRNPKNIDVEQALEEAKRKRLEELGDKKVIIVDDLM